MEAHCRAVIFLCTISVLGSFLQTVSSQTCNPKGFYCPDLHHFRSCLENSNTPEIQADPCPGDLVCSENCMSSQPCTADICPVTCNKNSYLPHSSNPSLYYNCTVNNQWEVNVTTVFCKENEFFNEMTSSCGSYNCTATGRYPNPLHCTKYHLCSKTVEGKFTRYDYDCPNKTQFDPALIKCVDDKNVCGKRPIP